MKWRNEKLEKVLQEHLPARCSDKALYITYAKEHSEVYKNLTEDQKQAFISVVLDLPLQSSMQRWRADLQNQKWLYEAPEIIKNKRREKQLEMQKKYSRDWSFLTKVFHLFSKS